MNYIYTKNRGRWLLVALASLIMISCDSSESYKPPITGRASEIVVVINKEQWNSDIGNVFRSTLGETQPFLPQPEPMFNLVPVPYKAFVDVLKKHRNIIIPNSEANTNSIEYKTDVWATPQLVIYINAKSSSDMIQMVEREKEKMVATLLEVERERIIMNIHKYEDPELRKIVIKEFGGSPYFPTGYVLRKQTADFCWISYETTYTNLGILIYKYPLTGKDDFSFERILKEKLEFMKANVPGQLRNTYMTVNMNVQQIPEIKKITIGKRDIIEMRGFWEVENDFMGGPFVSHYFIDNEGKNMIVLDAFIYSPRYNKRNYLRQVEAIISSFEFF